MAKELLELKNSKPQRKKYILKKITRRNYIKLLLAFDFDQFFYLYIFNFYSGLNNEYTFIVTEK